MQVHRALLVALTIAVSATAAGADAAATPPHARPLVVLDAGHGGSNPGAAGAVTGLFEKQLTLSVARQVRDRLAAAGIDVLLTRDRDATLTLRQRVALANQRAADVFVSIHANASPERVQRGYETFVLTAAGVDVDGRALRSESGTPRTVDAATALVLDDVERGAAQWEAADLAAAVQRELRAVRGADGDRGVRQDAHHVLLGATMPAVLVEIGFIDHPIEGHELAEPATQAAIADALARAIAAACLPSAISR
ncbi:MAG: N-acetylmuramoyl-L-alanine amidase [Myxococcales bacterium]|nr:N-acetylmuramoyl-L-alanine amidase [Myxococcales bacterium]